MNWPFSRRTIRTRLLIGVLLLVLVPLTAVNLVFVLSSLESGRVQAWRQLSSVAALKENALNSWKNQLSRSVLAIRIRQNLDRPGVEASGKALHDEILLENLFDELFVVDVRGRVLASSRQDSVGKVLTDKEYFSGLFTHGFVSAPFYELSRQTMAVVVSAPLMTPAGIITGSLAGVANLSLLDRVMAERTGLGETGETFLVGRNRSLVTNSRRLLRGERITSEGVDFVLEGKGTSENTYTTVSGTTMVATFRWIDSLKVALVAEQEQAEAVAPALGILGINLWIEAFFLLLAAVSSLWVSRSLTRPLEDLADTALKISRGSLELQAQEDGPWEVALVGQTFNAMTARLKTTISELTEYKGRLEELVNRRTGELAKAVAKAEESDRLKSAFLATMSHELRTPLNSIIGFTGILSQGLVGPVNEEQKKQLGFVMTSSRHLLDLISDILDISKIEAGELRTERVTFDMAALVTRAVKSVEPLAHKKNLRLTAEISPETGNLISDPRRVEQVLLNLLSNAVKFTDEGAVSVVCAPRGHQLEVAVTDTGHGIKPEDIEKLFRPFEQLDSGLNRMHQGTGLGLSICRRLLELMGGTIAVASQPGRGSTFTFTLPLSPRSA